MKVFFGAILILFSVDSCTWFDENNDREVVAQVGEERLYLEDIEDAIPASLAAVDSATLVTNYINRWATQRLLMDRSFENLPLTEQQELDAMVSDYKTDLYTRAYIEDIVKSKLDTVITTHQLNTYYEEHGSDFPLNEYLVKYRYILTQLDGTDRWLVKRQLTQFTAEDKQLLDSLSFRNVRQDLNDSIWKRGTQLFGEIPDITNVNAAQLLKNDKYLQFRDSTGVYLVQIKETLSPGDTPPLRYVSPTLKQIILNKRKLEFIKQFEQDILNNAIKNNKIEISN